MTKKEYFAEIVNLATANDREDLVEFAEKEIELLNKRNSKDSKAAKEKAEAREALKTEILDVVGYEPMRTMEIASALGVSTQKITPVLAALVADGKLVATTEKRVKTYRLVATDTDTD